jgi:hypothetical protein
VTPAPQPAPYIFYRYDPSLPAAVIFIALFAISTSLHAFQVLRKRTWYFLPFVIGGFCRTPPPFIERSGVADFSLNSRDRWLCWTCGFKQTNSKLDRRTLYCPELAHSVGSGSLRGFDLHGPWSNYPFDGWRAPLAYPCKMAHESVCSWRRVLLPDTIYRYDMHSRISHSIKLNNLKAEGFLLPVMAKGT